jgi:glycosyltransferase involved in cell wall biosynthesis/ADP-heptose:LPS heptosyltransferase
MKLVIDLQGAQTESAFRGIGRYSIELARALVRGQAQHEVVLCLNGSLGDSIERIRSIFADELPPENIRVWSAPVPVFSADPSNAKRREAAELIRESFIASLAPDAVLVTSLFEGFGDNAATSIGVLEKGIPTATVLYDLIPLLNPDENFRSSQVRIDWYSGKIRSLKNSALLLAISQNAAEEGATGLADQCPKTVTVGGGCDPQFREMRLSERARHECMQRNGISRPFLMYTGGADERKNLPRLIQAFAALPMPVRRAHQLVLVGKMPPTLVDAFRDTASESGLTDELVLTGYVSDSDLIRLYNCCTAFVFPSTHEGLGLPPLEAMACGAPVIAANATSLPEVVGLDDALFDPLSVPAITDSLRKVLVDDAFRERVIAHGRLHRQRFNWDDVARKVWDALGAVALKKPAGSSNTTTVRMRRTTRFLRKAQRILVVKLDHRGDLLLAVPTIMKLRARYPECALEGLVGSWNAEMARELKLFDEVHTLDFFKSASADTPGLSREQMRSAVLKLGHFDLALDLRRPADTRFILGFVDADVRAGYESFNSDVDALLAVKLSAQPDAPSVTTRLNRTHITEQMLCIVDALPNASSDYIALPRLGSAPDKRAARGFVGLFPSAGNDVKQWAPERFTELAKRLLKHADVKGINIYFGSETEARAFGLDGIEGVKRLVGLGFADLVESLKTNAVCVANNSFGAHIAGYLGCSVVGIYGGHETVAEWSPPFGDSIVLSVDKACSPCHIGARSQCPFGMACLEEITVDDVYNAVKKMVERPSIALEAAPDLNGGEEGVHHSTSRRLLDALSKLTSSGWTIDAKAQLARCVAGNTRPEGRNRQLLVDVTELSKHDSRSGIQRVTRAVLLALLRNPPEGFTVEPVVASGEHITAFRFARSFRQSILGGPLPAGGDDLVEAWHDDVFLGLDLNLTLSDQHWDQLRAWHRVGVNVHFVVYDLLPILRPGHFDEGLVAAFHQWLINAATFDSLLPISKSVEAEILDWLDRFGPQRARPLRTGWFHLGSDISESAPSKGMPAAATELLNTLSVRPTLLMVGTVEPRKGHALALSAVDQLWRQGLDFNLVVVGKEGWRIQELAIRLRDHPRRGTWLHWLEAASDEFLERLYEHCSVLLAASEGEGFGLPLAEAARRGVPVLARDIPVFREVAGSSAAYFPASATTEQLAASIQKWFDLFAKGRHPRSDRMALLDWKQSTDQLLSRFVRREWTGRWLGPDGVRLSALDRRIHLTKACRRQGNRIVATGSGGNLTFGPYIALAPGEYAVSIQGDSGPRRGSASFDVVHEYGTIELAKGSIVYGESGAWRGESKLRLTKSVRDLEVRAFAAPGADLSIERLAIVHSEPSDE